MAFFTKYVTMKNTVLFAMAVVVLYLCLVPLLTLLYSSFQTDFLLENPEWTFQHYIDAFTQSSSLSMFFNSMLYGFWTTVCSMAVGVGIAWLFTRTNTPFKSFALLSSLVPMIIPGILSTIAWIFLASPQIGIINNIFEHLIGIRPFNIYSLSGMVFVQSLHLMPIAFIMAVAVFSSMDASMEEAALASGANQAGAFGHITARLALPGLFSAALILFVETISSFEVPQLIGVPNKTYVFVSQIYDELNRFPANFGGAGALGMVILVIAFIGVVFSNRINSKGKRFATITGKGFKPALIDLGAWKWLGLAVYSVIFIIGVLLPLGVILWVSLLPSYEAPSMEALQKLTLNNYSRIWDLPEIKSTFMNSIQVSIITACVVVLLTMIISYITVKMRLRSGWLLDGLVFLPIAIPGIIMGVSVLFWYLVAPLPVSLYGTLTIIVIAFVTMYLPFGMRFLSAGFVQIKDELEEAAMASGASFIQTFIWIYAPLLVPSILAAFIYILIISLRQVSTAFFLVAQDNGLVAITIFDIWEDGFFVELAALGVIMVVISIILVTIFQKIAGKFGMQRIG